MPLILCAIKCICVYWLQFYLTKHICEGLATLVIIFLVHYLPSYFYWAQSVLKHYAVHISTVSFVQEIKHILPVLLYIQGVFVLLHCIGFALHAERQLAVCGDQPMPCPFHMAAEPVNSSE